MGAQTLVVSYIPGISEGDSGGWLFVIENGGTFSRERMAEKLTPMEKLESIPARLKMIPKTQMVLLNITADKPLDEIKIVGDILETFIQKEQNRLPILDENDYPKYMIHRSMIDKYLTQKNIEGGLSTDRLKKLSLKDLLDDDKELKKLFETSFVTIKEDANLADAKIEMDKVENCLDVFVTRNGTRNEPVIGWLTNLKVTESAKV